MSPNANRMAKSEGANQLPEELPCQMSERYAVDWHSFRVGHWPGQCYGRTLATMALRSRFKLSLSLEAVERCETGTEKGQGWCPC